MRIRHGFAPGTTTGRCSGVLPASWGPVSLMSVWTVAVVALLVGWRPLVSGLVCWACAISFWNINQGLCNGGDQIRNALFLGVAMGQASSAVWGVQSVRMKNDARPVLVPGWPMKVLLVQWACLYVFSALYKLRWPGWHTGDVMYYVNHDLEWCLTPNLSPYLPAFFHRASAWVAIGWELTFPLLIAFHRTRVFTLCLGVAFHVLTLFTLEVGHFATYSLAFYVVFVTWEPIPKNGVGKCSSSLPCFVGRGRAWLCTRGPTADTRRGSPVLQWRAHAAREHAMEYGRPGLACKATLDPRPTEGRLLLCTANLTASNNSASWRSNTQAQNQSSTRPSCTRPTTAGTPVRRRSASSVSLTPSALYGEEPRGRHAHVRQRAATDERFVLARTPTVTPGIARNHSANASAPVRSSRERHREHAERGHLAQRGGRIAVEAERGFERGERHLVEAEGSHQRIAFDLLNWVRLRPRAGCRTADHRGACRR